MGGTLLSWAMSLMCWTVVGSPSTPRSAPRDGTVAVLRRDRPSGVDYDALFDEKLVLLGEDGAPFLDPRKPKAYLITGPSWVNNHAHVLRAKQVTTNRFLKYALDVVDYGPFVRGTTRLKLTQKDMRRIPIRIPPPR